MRPAAIIGYVFFLSGLLCALPVAGADSLAAEWAGRVIPLPKVVSVDGVREMPVSEVGLETPESASAAVATIRELLTPVAPGTPAGMVIRFEVRPEEPPVVTGGASEDGPSPVANSDQAYGIVPIMSEGGGFAGLLVTAQSERGLLYGARTLRQMMLPALRTDSAGEPMVTVPQLRLADWPDMPERGCWAMAIEDLAPLAEWKYDTVDEMAKVSYDESQGRGVASMDRAFLDEAARVGIDVIAIISHLEHMYRRTDLYTKRPELAATPDPSRPIPRGYEPTFCFSKPGTEEVIGDWMEDLARTPSVKDIIVWLSENETPCYCDACRDTNAFLLELRALVNAFERVKPVNPSMGLRILLSQGSYAVNGQLLEAAPPGVKFVYYHGALTYDSTHKPMIYPLLEAYAGQLQLSYEADFRLGGAAGEPGEARKGWLGIIPQITNSWACVTPWTAPQFIRFRATEFVEKNLQNVTFYAVPDRKWHEYNVAALGEWSWNSTGRDDREFSRAWAFVRGMRDPDGFARWADLIGPVGWDLAGSRLAIWMNYYFEIAEALRLGKRVRYGELFLKEIYSADHLARLKTQTREALALAEDLRDPQAIAESRIHGAFLTIAGALQTLSEAPRSAEGLREGELERFRVAAADLDAAARTLEVEHLRWAEMIAPGERPGRLMHTLSGGYAFASRGAEVLARLGIEDPMPAYHFQPVGTWTPDTFAEGEEAEATLGFGLAWIGPGPYVIEFEYDHGDGTYGIRVEDVTLLSVAPDGTEAELGTVRAGEGLSRWGRRRETRFDFPSLPLGHEPRMRVRMRMGGDAPEGEHASYGSFRVRAGLRGVQ